MVQAEAGQSFIIDFFSPSLEHFCPRLYKLPRWVSICPNGVLFLPEYHPQLLSFTQPSHTPFGDMYVHRTPQNPPQNTPFPGLNLKVGKLKYCQGKLDPNWAILNIFEKWATSRKVLSIFQKHSRSGPFFKLLIKEVDELLINLLINFFTCCLLCLSPGPLCLSLIFEDCNRGPGTSTNLFYLLFSALQAMPSHSSLSIISVKPKIRWLNFFPQV